MTTKTAPGYRIAEVARRTGFSPATLRYYEQVGVLPPPERSQAGYRLYRECDVERLTFVARAKDLGCSLAEITELAEAWDTGECRPVKQRLRALVDARITDVRRRTAEMVRFTAQLQATASSLSSEPVEGPCDTTCGCTSGVGADHPISCSLDGAEMGTRLDEWRAVLGDVERRIGIEGGLRLELRPEAPLGDIARLAAAEHECCPFFAFVITVDDRGVALEVTAPAEAADVVAMVAGLSG